jgi:hypothetical protein
MAPLLCQEHRQNSRNGPERSFDVEVDRGFPLRGVDLGQGADEHDANAINQHVQRAEIAYDGMTTALTPASLTMSA